MNTQVSPPSCGWCALPKARKGLILGFVSSLLLHAVALGGVAYLGSESKEIKKPTRVIYLGEITLAAPKKAKKQNTREI